MPVTLTDDDVLELRRLLRGLDRNPFEQGEIGAMGGLRAILSRDLLAKLCVHVPESPRAELLYTPPVRQVASEEAPTDGRDRARSPTPAVEGDALAGSLPEPSPATSRAGFDHPMDAGTCERHRPR